MSACRSCGADIQWATTQAGKQIPLDMTPVELGQHGAMVVVEAGPISAYSLAALTTSMAERQGISTQRAAARIVEEYEAFESHFATCPNADQHRRTR